jgi:hypothetical protein
MAQKLTVGAGVDIGHSGGRCLMHHDHDGRPEVFIVMSCTYKRRDQCIVTWPSKRRRSAKKARRHVGMADQHDAPLSNI